jgi:hypothetical protein
VALMDLHTLTMDGHAVSLMASQISEVRVDFIVCCFVSSIT